MRLADHERAELAPILADSIGDGSSEPEIEAAWIAEAKRRLDDVRAGRSRPVAFDEVTAKLRAMVEGAGNPPTASTD